MLQKLSIERVVAILTPAFAALAGLVTTEVGRLVPGVNLSNSQVTALFVTGAVAAASAALKWLHGRQKFVGAITDTEKIVQEVVARVQAGGGAPLVDVEQALEAHTNQIIAAIGQAVHAPASADQVVEAMAQKLIGGTTQPPGSPAARTSSGGTVTAGGPSAA